MGFFGDLFGGGANAYEDAQEEYQKHYDQAQGYLEPYAQYGQQYGGDLRNMFQQLMNPQQMYNDWATGYEESPYAQMLLGQNTASGLDAASSMGLMGSSAALQNIQQGAGNIMNSQRQQYMDDLMQKYMQAVGLGQSMYGSGMNASNAMSQNAMNFGGDMADLAYNEAAAPTNMFGNLLSGAAGLIASPIANNVFGKLTQSNNNNYNSPSYENSSRPTYMGWQS